MPLIAALATVLLAVFPTAARAQSPSAVGLMTQEFFGLGFGQESLATGNPAGRRTGSVIGAFLVLPVWRAISLEGRVSHHQRPGAGNYLGQLILDRTGTFTVDSSHVAAGDFAAVDLRLRLVAGPPGLVLGLGAGWAASTMDLPYLVSFAGVRAGSRVRWGFDVEVGAYRVPWTARTAEYLSGSIVQERSTRLYKTWATSYGVRFSVELPVVHGG